MNRLNKERQELEKAGFKVENKTDTQWSIMLPGPENTPFEGGIFEIEMKLQNFPFKSPVVMFKTQIYHPNVNKTGQICSQMIEIGEKHWSPTKKLIKVVEKIISLMAVPNLETPVNGEAAEDHKNGKWQAKARERTLAVAK